MGALILMFKLLLISALLVFGLSTGVASGELEKKPMPELPSIDVAELRLVAGSRDSDRMISAINRAKMVAHIDCDIVPFILGLWRRDKAEFADLPWDFLSTPLIRAELANLLVQARRNGLVEIDPSEFREFLLPYLHDADRRMVGSVLSSLGSLDDPGDVERIAAHIDGGEGRSFKSAVIALARMCNAAAGRELDKVERELSDPAKLQFVADIRGFFEEKKAEGFLCREPSR